MISYIQGTIQKIYNQFVIVNTNGIGYEIELPTRIALQLIENSHTELWVQQIIREDANLLYGFTNFEDRETFKLLLKAPQIGPKVALAILDTFTSNSLAQITSAQNLLKVKGLGAKLADRLIIDIKSWKEKGLLNTSAITEIIEEKEAMQALLQLGYKESEAKKALKDKEGSTQELIRQALKILARNN